MVQCSRQGDLVAKVSGQANDHEPRILRCCFFQQFQSSVGTAIVNNDNLVRSAGDCVENSRSSAEKFRYEQLFVKDRYRD
jgi:hypothetical protein